MRYILVILTFLIIIFSSVFVFADCTHDLPFQVSGTYKYLYSDDNDSIYTAYFVDGPFTLQGYICAKNRVKNISGSNRYYYYFCSCASFMPEPGWPYSFDPNNPPSGSPHGNPADPANGGPEPECDCTIERVCYNSSNQAVYYEIDCCGTLFVYGDIATSVRCFSTTSGESGPPIGAGNVPELILDTDNGWCMPPLYSGPEEGYDQPNSADEPDSDGDGIPDYRDLAPNGLADGSDNPAWREILYTIDVDGNKTGGVYEIEGGGFYAWGDRSAGQAGGGGLDYAVVGPEWSPSGNFGNNSAGGGWSQSGGGGGATNSGTYDANTMPVDPANPTADEIETWEANDPSPPIDFGEVEIPRENYETGSGASGDPANIVDSDISELAQIMSGIEQDQKGYGDATLLGLEAIANLLQEGDTTKDENFDASLAGGYSQLLGVYYDEAGLDCGWLFANSKNPADPGDMVTFQVGKRSSNFIQTSSNWFPSSEMWADGNAWTPYAGTSGWENDGSGSGSGEGITGDDVAGALAGDRVLSNADAESARVSQNVILDGVGSGVYDPYVEADIPDTTTSQTDYETAVNNQITTSDLSSVKDQLGVNLSAPVSSVSCCVFGATIDFDFGKYDNIFAIMGVAWLSLCYLAGFFLILK